MPPLNFLPLRNGRLSLSNRPRLDSLPELRQAGLAHLVSLLNEAENPGHLGNCARQAGLDWTWLPMRGAKHLPQGENLERMRQGMLALLDCLEQGQWLLVHCAAGIHRTGAIGYALLRLNNYTQEDALQALVILRPEIAPFTQNGLKPVHIDWVEVNLLPGIL